MPRQRGEGEPPEIDTDKLNPPSEASEATGVEPALQRDTRVLRPEPETAVTETGDQKIRSALLKPLPREEPKKTRSSTKERRARIDVWPLSPPEQEVFQALLIRIRELTSPSDYRKMLEFMQSSLENEPTREKAKQLIAGLEEEIARRSLTAEPPLVQTTPEKSQPLRRAKSRPSDSGITVGPAETTRTRAGSTITKHPPATPEAPLAGSEPQSTEHLPTEKPPRKWWQIWRKELPKISRYCFTSFNRFL